MFYPTLRAEWLRGLEGIGRPRQRVGKNVELGQVMVYGRGAARAPREWKHPVLKARRGASSLLPQRTPSTVMTRGCVAVAEGHEPPAQRGSGPGNALPAGPVGRPVTDSVIAVAETDVAEGAPPCPTAHPRLALLALATGGFAIGTTEFVTMGLLPEAVSYTHLTLPTTERV